MQLAGSPQRQPSKDSQGFHSPCVSDNLGIFLLPCNQQTSRNGESHIQWSSLVKEAGQAESGRNATEVFKLDMSPLVISSGNLEPCAYM